MSYQKEFVFYKKKIQQSTTYKKLVYPLLPNYTILLFSLNLEYEWFQEDLTLTKMN